MEIVLWFIGSLIGGFLLFMLHASLGVYKNWSKVKHIPGAYQFIFSFWRIPFLAPYIYFGNVKEFEPLMNNFGDTETKTFRISTMHENTVFISDPAMLKEFYLTKANNFEKPTKVYEMFNHFGENILSALNTESWRKHHRVCAPAFSSTNLEYMCEVAANSSDLLFKRWNESIQKHDCHMVTHNDFSNVTADVIGKAGFNIDFAIFSEDEEGRKFRHSMEVIINQAIVLRRFISNPFFSNLITRITGMDKSIKHCSSRLDEIINERTTTIEKRMEKQIAGEDDDERMRDILSLLVEANCVEKVLSIGELKSNALIMV